MNPLKLEKDIIIKRMAGIETELEELKQLGKQDFQKLAQFHLHRALEGVFNIGSHLLSRIPGATATQYKEIALKLGEYKLAPSEFSRTKLVEMAKYRNRLVHFYAQVEAKELYGIIRNDLADFETFLKAVKAVLVDPAKFHLAV